MSFEELNVPKNHIYLFKPHCAILMDFFTLASLVAVLEYDIILEKSFCAIIH